MITKVPVTSDKGRGTVVYNDSGIAEVTFSDEEQKHQIKRYLSTAQKFNIPQSQEIDDFDIVKAVPITDRCYYELAMSTLHAKYGIYVNWDLEKEIKE